jgi:phosphate transport system substrate-binding protein
VNRANPVASLTIQQIAALFSGGDTSWSAVGGSGASVKIYARDEKSGTYDTFKSLVLGKLALTSNAQRFEDSRALSEAVSNARDGIGFVGLPYIGSAKAIAVSEPGARALLPNKFTVATEDYLLSRRLYLYSPSSLKPLARKFLDFAVSKAGQDIVAENGFVEQNVRVEESTQPVEGASPQYL